ESMGSTRKPHPSGIQTRQWVHLYRHRQHAGVKPGTRPNPIGCLLDQAPANRIVVDVFDHLQQCPWLDHVPIVAPTSLPETIVHFSVWLYILEMFQKIRSSPPKKLQGLSSHRSLQGGADQPDLVFLSLRPDDQVHVLRHDDVGPDKEPVFSPRLFHCVHKPTPSPVPVQQRQTVKAREGQLMSMAWLVVASD